MDMFPLEMDNDLKAVDTAIREYYGLAKVGAPVKKKEQKPSASVKTVDKVPG